MQLANAGHFEQGSCNLSPILSGRVGDGAPLSSGIYVAVAAVACSIGVRLLLEVDAVFLGVGGSKLSIAGQVPLFTDDGGRLRVSVVRLSGRQSHNGSKDNLQGY